MDLVFEWNEEKNLANRRKHGVSFDEARTAERRQYRWWLR
jgi:uncharacterized DUF497 family protein